MTFANVILWCTLLLIDIYYFLRKKTFRLPKVVAVSILLVLSIILVFIYTTFNTPIHIYFFGVEFSLAISVIIIINFIVNIILYKNINYFSLIFLVIFCLTEIIIKLLFNYFLEIPYSDLNINNAYFYFSDYFNLMFLLITIIYLFIYFLIDYKKQAQKKIFIVLILLYILLCSSFIIFFFVSYKYIFTSHDLYTKTITFMSCLFFTISISLILCIYLFNRFLQNQKDLEKYKMEALNTNFNNILMLSQEELLKIKHDLANITSVLRVNENQNKLIIDELENKLQDINQFTFSKNNTLNALLTILEKKAKEKAINIERKIQYPFKDVISALDLISLISNLFDNAIESINSNNKDIYYEIIYNENSLFINFSNTYENEISIKDPIYHRKGTLIIKDIVKKYHGSIEINKTASLYEVIINFKDI